jgi:hypothetical protein
VNATESIYYPSAARSGALYFAAAYAGDARPRIYCSQRAADGAYGAPDALPFSLPGDLDPTVDAEERFLVFASARPGGFGGMDLYLAFRRDGAWGEAIHLPSPINAPGSAFATGLSRNGRTLYFASARPEATQHPKPKEDYAALTRRLRRAGGGSADIWEVDLGPWLDARMPK